MHVDLKDPIQVHLLTETALFDSQKFEILSQEEVDHLKKQIQSLTMRIDQARTNLAIQSKYRDAAISMAKLYSPRPEGKRRSLISNRHSDAAAREAELEKQASERRCEELASELFMLEKRLMEPQKRLLQHTAGILQLTHRGSSKKSGQLRLSGQPLVNGVPGSPESLYTYTNTRNSLEPPAEDGLFDDRSLYLPLDQMDGQPARMRKTPIEIPMKSPIREQNNQLREEMDRVKEENERLKAAEEQLATVEQQMRETEQQLSEEVTALQTRSSGQLQLISDTERKLEALNNKLRDVIITLNPEKNADFDKPRANDLDIEDALANQLEYLEKGLETAAEEQKLSVAQSSDGARSAQEAAIAAAAASSTLAQTETRIEDLNRQIYLMVQASNPNKSPPPDSGAGSLDEQLDYLENALETIESDLSRTAELSSSASTTKQNSDQVEAVLMGLWDIIHTGYAEILEAKAARREKRAKMGLEPDEEDALSGDEAAIDLNEQYSLQGFSAKVQWLYSQATKLKEQKGVLQRQIKQQRELNNKSGQEKDEELRELTEELESTRALLQESELAVSETQERLEDALENLATLQKASAENENTSARAVQDQARLMQDRLRTAQDQLEIAQAQFKAAQDELEENRQQLEAKEGKLQATEEQFKSVQEQLQERTAVISTLESSYADVQARLAAAEQNLAALQAQLGEATEAQAAAEATAEQLRRDFRAKEEELEQLNMMVIELKTEVTIAKAELDGAYGSRAQRAAEAAALTKSSETDVLNQQVVKLRAELEGTLKDFEDITKESIAAEREKLDLEARLDDALADRTQLEAEVKTLRDRLEREVNGLKEQLDKERLKVPPSPGPGGAMGVRVGATMLSEQFRASMREERKKHLEELRVSFPLPPYPLFFLSIS